MQPRSRKVFEELHQVVDSLLIQVVKSAELHCIQVDTPRVVSLLTRNGIDLSL